MATGNYGLRTYVLPQGYCISFRCSWGRGAQHLRWYVLRECTSYSRGRCVRETCRQIKLHMPRSIVFKYMSFYFYFYIHFHFFPIFVSVVCPTGPHPPPRLAIGPDRDHIGGGGAGPPPAVHASDLFFIASGFSTSTADIFNHSWGSSTRSS